MNTKTSGARNARPINPLNYPVDKAKSHSAPSRAAPIQASHEMTTQQVVTALRAIRYSPQAERVGRQQPGIRTIARHAGLSFRTVYSIANSGSCTDAQRRALAEAYAAVQNRRFKNRRQEPL